MKLLRGKISDQHPPEDLRNNPIFNGSGFGMLTAQRPKYQPAVPGENDAMELQLKAMGLPYEKTKGAYDGPEESFIVHGPTQEQMHSLGKKFGQESVVWSQGGQHRMLYTNGPNEGQYNPSLPSYEYWPAEEGPPENYFTQIPQNGGFVRLHFDWDTLKPAGLVYHMPRPATQPAAAVVAKSEGVTRQDIASGLLRALKKSLAGGGQAHPHSYPWHDSHTDHHPAATTCGGVAFSSKRTGLQKDEAGGSNPLGGKTSSIAHPHTDGAIPGQKNDQAAGAGVQSYARFALPYGNIDKSTPSQLAHYNYAGKSHEINQLLRNHGYEAYYAGGKYGKPDLANRNYNTGHLMIYDPTPQSGGDFGDFETTDNWRKIHELAHALTYPELNKMYGEGRRIGRLGKHRTLREAQRAVHWEWLAGHKQRELSKQIGVELPDDMFHREINTVMHDALHRAVTGKFTEPSDEGFKPHSHLVPLDHALATVAQEARNLGLQGPHDLMAKAEDNNISTDTIRQGLADSLKKAVKDYEAYLLDLRKKETEALAKKAASLSKIGLDSHKELAGSLMATHGPEAVAQIARANPKMKSPILGAARNVVQVPAVGRGTGGIMHTNSTPARSSASGVIPVAKDEMKKQQLSLFDKTHQTKKPAFAQVNDKRSQAQAQAENPTLAGVDPEHGPQGARKAGAIKVNDRRHHAQPEEKKPAPKTPISSMTGKILPNAEQKAAAKKQLHGSSPVSAALADLKSVMSAKATPPPVPAAAPKGSESVDWGSVESGLKLPSGQPNPSGLSIAPAKSFRQLHQARLAADINSLGLNSPAPSAGPSILDRFKAAYNGFKMGKGETELEKGFMDSVRKRANPLGLALRVATATMPHPHMAQAAAHTAPIVQPRQQETQMASKKTPAFSKAAPEMGAKPPSGANPAAPKMPKPAAPKIGGAPAGGGATAAPKIGGAPKAPKMPKATVPATGASMMGKDEVGALSGAGATMAAPMSLAELKAQKVRVDGMLKPAGGGKLPGDQKVKDISPEKQGSGGETKKLKKDSMSPTAGKAIPPLHPKAKTVALPGVKAPIAPMGDHKGNLLSGPLNKAKILPFPKGGRPPATPHHPDSLDNHITALPGQDLGENLSGFTLVRRKWENKLNGQKFVMDPAGPIKAGDPRSSVAAHEVVNKNPGESDTDHFHRTLQTMIDRGGPHAETLRRMADTNLPQHKEWLARQGEGDPSIKKNAQMGYGPGAPGGSPQAAAIEAGMQKTLGEAHVDKSALHADRASRGAARLAQMHAAYKGAQAVAPAAAQPAPSGLGLGKMPAPTSPQSAAAQAQIQPKGGLIDRFKTAFNGGAKKAAASLPASAQPLALSEKSELVENLNALVKAGQEHLEVLRKNDQLCKRCKSAQIEKGNLCKGCDEHKAMRKRQGNK